MLVTIRPVDDDDDDDETYLLAEHAEERAPGARTVTTTSPLGAALVGAAAEQEVAYEAPGRHGPLCGRRLRTLRGLTAV